STLLRLDPRKAPTSTVLKLGDHIRRPPLGQILGPQVLRVSTEVIYETELLIRCRQLAPRLVPVDKRKGERVLRVTVRSMDGIAERRCREDLPRRCEGRLRYAWRQRADLDSFIHG